MGGTYRSGAYAPAYLAPKMLVWLALLGVALRDAWRHRNAHPLGVNLHRAITGVVGAFALASAVALLWAVTPGNPTSGYGFLIFVEDAADALFLGLLLLVSCGYCITRSVLASHASRVIVLGFPTVNLLTSLTADYIMVSVSGTSTGYGPDGRIHIATAWKRGLFIFTDFVRLMALFYGWWWIFVCVGEERKILLARVSVALQQAAATPAAVPAEGTNAEDLAVDGSAEAEAAAAAAAVANDSTKSPAAPVMAGAAGPSPAARDEDLDTAQLPDRAKLRLLTRFFWLVQLYLVFVVSLLLYRAWSHSSSAGLMIALDALNWLACVGLVATFRLRPSNPYFILSDFEGGGEAGQSLMDYDDADDDHDAEDAEDAAGARLAQGAAVGNQDIADGGDCMKRPPDTQRRETTVANLTNAFSIDDD